MTRKEKREVKRQRDLVRSYKSKAIDAYIDDNMMAYNYWMDCAMEASDKVLTMTGFKQRGREATQKKRGIVYVPVGR